MSFTETLNREQLDEFESLQDGDFEGFFEAGEPRPLIPERNYVARCIGIAKGYYYQQLKIYLRFQIIEPYEYEGTPLFMAMNAFKVVQPSSKYYQQWVIANDNINPARKDRMSPSIFKDRIFEVIVRTVRPKNKDGTHKNMNTYYSVIDSIIERLS